MEKKVRNMNAIKRYHRKGLNAMITQNSQSDQLLGLMQKVPVVTVQYINHKLALNSPRKVISDLRKKGYKICDRYVSHMDAYGQTVRYKEYWLEENDHANVL